jgi:hypothetical protein
MLALRTRSLGLCLAAAALIALSVSASARADAVTDWNVNAVNALVTTAGQSPTVSTVHLAMVHGAVRQRPVRLDQGRQAVLDRRPRALSHSGPVRAHEQELRA